jgi:hypothetical protein
VLQLSWSGRVFKTTFRTSSLGIIGDASVVRVVKISSKELAVKKQGKKAIVNSRVVAV